MNEKANKIKIYLTSLLEKYAPESVVLLDLLCDMISEKEDVPVSDRHQSTKDIDEGELFEDYSNLNDIIEKYDRSTQFVTFKIRNLHYKVKISSLFKMIELAYEFKNNQKHGIADFAKKNLSSHIRGVFTKFLTCLSFLEHDRDRTNKLCISENFPEHSSFEEFFSIFQKEFEKQIPSSKLFEDMRNTFLSTKIDNQNEISISENEVHDEIPEKKEHDLFDFETKKPLRNKFFDEKTVQDFHLEHLNPYTGKYRFKLYGQYFFLEKHIFLENLYFFYLWDDEKEPISEVIKNNSFKALITRLMCGLFFAKKSASQGSRMIKVKPFSFENFRSFVAEVKARYEKICGPIDIFDIEG